MAHCKELYCAEHVGDWPCPQHAREQTEHQQARLGPSERMGPPLSEPARRTVAETLLCSFYSFYPHERAPGSHAAGPQMPAGKFTGLRYFLKNKQSGIWLTFTGNLSEDQRTLMCGDISVRNVPDRWPKSSVFWENDFFSFPAPFQFRVDGRFTPFSSSAWSKTIRWCGLPCQLLLIYQPCRLRFSRRRNIEMFILMPQYNF